MNPALAIPGLHIYRLAPDRDASNCTAAAGQGGRSMDLAGASFRREFAKSLQEPGLDRVGGPCGQVLALDRGRERRRAPEEAPRLGGLEPGKARRLEIGGRSVRGLDQPLHLSWQFRRKPEPDPDRRMEAGF